MPRGKEECQCIPSPPPFWVLGAPRIHACSHLQVLGVADGGVEHGAHPCISGVCEMAKGWGAGESQPVHLSKRACMGRREGWG